MWKRHWPIILILILAFAVRSYALTDLPPGLTHDEANHGREAIGILDGILLFYFPLNYGSEPLYSYTVAASMALLGENLFALRLVNVIFGVLAIGATYAWVYRVFDRKTALLTAVLMAVSFWPLASSRQALRAGMLPFFMVGAVWFYWQILLQKQTKSLRAAIWPTLGFGVCLAITLHIYLAARVVWLVFPVFLIYLGVIHRDAFKRVWLPTFVGLLLAGILVTPMFLYVQRYPYVLTRLDMLDGPLQELRSGNLLPILQNAAEALLAFVWPGLGDQFLAYNIPGRPVFDAVTAVFFIVGVLLSIWRWRKMNAAFLLIWFIIGIAPSLITGPTANTTRNLAALPVTFIFPAVGFWSAAQVVSRRLPTHSKTITYAGLVLWIFLAGGMSVRDYFVSWGQNAAVRGAYQVNLAAGLAENAHVDTAVVISTVYPGPAHDPSIALVLSREQNRRWVDARYALVLPEGAAAHAVIPTSTPPHPAFAPFLANGQRTTLRETDLDPSFTTYQLDTSPLNTFSLDTAVNVNNALKLRHASWLNPAVHPGETAELLTIWEVTDPTQTGPLVPPAFTTDVVMFTQVLDDDGRPFAQRDSLEAPSWDWQTGDIILQIHPISVPSDLLPGTYPAIIGLYDKASGERLSILNETDTAVDDKISAPPLEVNSP